MVFVLKWDRTGVIHTNTFRSFSDTRIQIILDDDVAFPFMLVPICRSIGRYHHFEQRQLRGTIDVWVTWKLSTGEWKEVCFTGSYNVFDLWNVQIVNVTGSARLSSYTVDSPDSSSIRLVTYLLGKWTGSVSFVDFICRRWGYNMNSFYNHEYVKRDNTEQFLLSPYGPSCFNFSCPTREKQGINISILRYKGPLIVAL